MKKLAALFALLTILTLVSCGASTPAAPAEPAASASAAASVPDTSEPVADPVEEPAAEPAGEPIVVEPAEEPAEAVDTPDYSEYVGDYCDNYSQRALMVVKENEPGDSINIVINWSSSASEYTEWEMNAKLAGSTLTYTDCVMRTITTDDSGNNTIVEEYTDGIGYFTVSDNTLAWDGAADESCQSCVFEHV